MIILSEVQPYGFKLLEEINKFSSLDKKVTSIAYYHGTFDNRRLGFTYATDIDCENWIEYTGNNKKDLYNHIISITDFLLTKNLYYLSLKAGKDDRFVFDFSINNKGQILNYNYDDIQKRLTKLNNDKIITKNDLESLLNHVIEIPTLISIEKLKFTLEKYKDIEWSFNEFKKGEKKHYGKNFKLYDIFMEDIFKYSFIFEYKEGSYILFDMAFRVFELGEYCKNLDITSIKYREILNYKCKLYGEEDRKDAMYLYEGIFKNYIQEKYFKMLKRIRSLLSMLIYKDEFFDKSHNYLRRNKEFKFILRRIRTDITNIVMLKKYSCLNQIKNRVDIIVSFIEKEYKDELEIKRLIVELLKDTLLACNYQYHDIKVVYDNLEKFNINSSENNKNNLVSSLKIFKKDVFKTLNMAVLPELISIYDRMKKNNVVMFDIVLPLPN